MTPFPAPHPGGERPRGQFRADVEGLRAVAVAMVLLYHFGVRGASGGFAGVDVFFVISGFLITRQLVAEIDATGTVSLVRFYARRAKRLLPAAALVLVATAVLAALWLPATRWREIGGDLAAAAAYFINWRLAARSVDYLAEDSLPSPAQHFWSLAVEEQYYLAWPVLLVLGLFAARRWLSRRGCAWMVLVLIALPSFAWSVLETRAHPGPAFFSTPARMWELAIGGAVALSAGYWQRLPAAPARTLAWLGLAALAAALVLVTPKLAWPGVAAAWPVLGAAAVIAGGFNAGRGGPVAILGTRAACWIGGLSYSLYLWHWPLVVVALAGAHGLDGWRAPALAALCVLLAWLTRRFVEDPVRFSSEMSARPRYALAAGLNFSLLGVVAGLGLALAGGGGDAPAQREGVTLAAGARVLRERPRNDRRGAPVDRVDWITPDPADATRDVPRVYLDGCHLQEDEDTPRPCLYGKPDGAVTIAVVGDSKIAQWLPALELLADRNDWRILVHTKSACGFNAGKSRFHGRPYPSCGAWNRAVLERLLGPDRPDFLLTSQAHSRSDGSTKAMEDALLAWWRPLQASGVRIIAFANNQTPPMNVYECVAGHSGHLKACAFKRKTAPSTRVLRKAAKRLRGVGFVDLNDAICPTSRCAPVIGNVLVYRQTSHLTRTYVQTMAPRLEAALARAGVPVAGRARPAAAGNAAN